MSRRNHDLARLADLRITVSETTREGHLSQIAVAVRTAPPVRTTRRLGIRRRWATAVASAALIVGPVGTAVAAEDSLPDDLLYPVKQVSERVRGVFDDDLAATHRVEELEGLLDRGADRALIGETERRATEAVAELDDAGDLGPRLERARLRIRRQAQDGSGPGRGGAGRSGNDLDGFGTGAPAENGPVDGPAERGGESAGSTGSSGSSGLGSEPVRQRDQSRDGSDGGSAGAGPPSGNQSGAGASSGAGSDDAAESAGNGHAVGDGRSTSGRREG